MCDDARTVKAPRPGRCLREPAFWALAALGVAFFHRPLFGRETFFYRDLYLYFAPMRRRYAELLRAGEWPLWNPDLHGGIPFLADFSNSAFYPSNLLHLLLPTPRALSLEVAVHVLAAAAAVYVLARCLELSPPAAALAGVVFAYSGLSLSQANLFIRLLALPYLPLLILFWHLFLVDGRRRWFALAAGCGALQVLAGAPETVAVSLVTALGWGLVAGGGNGWGGARRRAGLWLLLSLAVAGLAACQLAPGAEMVARSDRGAGLDLEVIGAHSLAPRRLPEMVLPGWSGRTDRVLPGDYWGSRVVDGGFPYFLSLYAGLVALALAVLAAGDRGPGAARRRFLALLLTLGALLALGRNLPLFETLIPHLPGAGAVRYPVKALILSLLPLAILAGRGTEILLSRLQRRAILAAGWSVAALLGLLVLGWRLFPAAAGSAQLFFFERAAAEIDRGIHRALVHAFAAWLLALLVALWFRRRPRAWLPWALVGVVAWDLLSAGRTVNPTVADGLFQGMPPAAVAARREIGDGRLYRSPVLSSLPLGAPSGDIAWLYLWDQEVLRDYLGAWYGLPVIYHGDYNGLAPRRVMLLKWTVEALPWERRLPLLSAAAVRLILTDESLGLPGVERLATVDNRSGRPFYLYRNRRAADRVGFVTVCLGVSSPEEAMGALLAPGFDPRQHAVVEGLAPAAGRRSVCPRDPEVRVIAATRERRTVEVATECAGALVFAETHYPGWRARVDGRPAPLLRANVAFQAVWLEPGRHTVELRYAPKSLALGLAVSALTALGLLFGALTRPARPPARRGRSAGGAGATRRGR